MFSMVEVKLVSVGLVPRVVKVLLFKVSVSANDLFVLLFSFSKLVICVV